MIFSTVYVSTANHPWTADDLVTLLGRCRARNATLDVTGLLVYRDGAFMQVLEGDEGRVRGLFRRIAVDGRHHDVLNIWTALAPRRRFPDWSMGFRNLAEHPVDVPGYRDLLVQPLDLRRLGRRDTVAELLALVAPAPAEAGDTAPRVTEDQQPPAPRWRS